MPPVETEYYDLVRAKAAFHAMHLIGMITYIAAHARTVGGICGRR